MPHQKAFLAFQPTGCIFCDTAHQFYTRIIFFYFDLSLGYHNLLLVHGHSPMHDLVRTNCFKSVDEIFNCDNSDIKKALEHYFSFQTPCFLIL